ERNPGYAHHVSIWEVARATTAAPTYFQYINIDNRKFLDGGFAANNPVTEIFNEVQFMNGGDESVIKLLLSIGTGLKKPPPSRDSKSHWGYIPYLFNLVREAIRKSTDCEKEHDYMNRLTNGQHGADHTRIPYYRLNVPYRGCRGYRLDAKPRVHPIEACNSDTLQTMARCTNAYINDPMTQNALTAMAEILVQGRRERSSTPGWEVFSTGTYYRCMATGCASLKSHRLRNTRRKLELHLTNRHGISKNDIEAYVEKGRCPY
ncbi:FabD/lysophospholipase-like protein, partial [Lepidopterella palustris CBS 459.81]